MHTWMSQARSLAPSFTAPLTLPQPTVRLAASAALRPSAVADPYEPRVALLREDCAFSVIVRDNGGTRLRKSPHLPSNPPPCNRLLAAHARRGSPN